MRMSLVGERLRWFVFNDCFIKFGRSLVTFVFVVL
jgi:hypothetical protein